MFMGSELVNAGVIPLAEDFCLGTALATIMHATVTLISEDGCIGVTLVDGRSNQCAWLETGSNAGIMLVPGDTVLVLLPAGTEKGVVLGRVGRYRAPEPPVPQPNVTIEAGETLTLKCGESSVDLRADGKVMVRGEDVLLRAKGTQRIRAGTVAIN
jgi:hypothetical protein